jgi:hypothetical protein
MVCSEYDNPCYTTLGECELYNFHPLKDNHNALKVSVEYHLNATSCCQHPFEAGKLVQLPTLAVLDSTTLLHSLCHELANNPPYIHKSASNFSTIFLGFRPITPFIHSSFTPGSLLFTSHLILFHHIKASCPCLLLFQTFLTLITCHGLAT